MNLHPTLCTHHGDSDNFTPHTLYSPRGFGWVYAPHTLYSPRGFGWVYAPHPVLTPGIRISLRMIPFSGRKHLMQSSPQSATNRYSLPETIERHVQWIESSSFSNFFPVNYFEKSRPCWNSDSRIDIGLGNIVKIGQVHMYRRTCLWKTLQFGNAHWAHRKWLCDDLVMNCCAHWKFQQCERTLPLSTPEVTLWGRLGSGNVSKPYRWAHRKWPCEDAWVPVRVWPSSTGVRLSE